LKHTTEVKLNLASSTVFKTVCDRYSLEDSMSLLMSHCGILSQDLVNSLGEGAEELLIGLNEKRPMIRRIFSLLIEGLQNIKIHGEADSSGVKSGLFVFAKGENCYKITFGNAMFTEFTDSLKERLDELNTLDEVALKQRYMQVLSDGILSNKGGAGLGFITMKMKAKSNVNYQIIPVSETFSIFTYELVIQRVIE
jgi:hypothetical protein